MVTGTEFEDADDAAAAGDELDLSDTDSLPWLEADEDDEDAGGVDTAQIVGFGLILLVLLAGVVGGIYYLGNRGGSDEIVADGSTIPAPEGPIKERPEDPGGKEFAGTGNVAPGVSEGKTPDTQVGDGTPNGGSGTGAASGSQSGQSASGSGSGAQSGSQSGSSSQSASSSAGVGVQLAAYSSRARAEQGWSDLSRQTSALSGQRYRVVEAEVGGATVYRLQAVANDRAAADTLCRAIKADGLDCAVKP